MKPIEKIYTVYEGEVYGVDINKETKKRVFVDADAVLGFRRSFDKEHVCLTPQEAILEEKNRALTQVGMFKDGLARAKARLQQVLDLENKENK